MPVVTRLLEAAAPLPPAPLLWREEMPEALLASHDGAGEAPAVDLLSIPRALFGGRGLAARKGTPAIEPGFLPAHVRHILRRQRGQGGQAEGWLGGLLGPGVEALRSRHPILAPANPLWIWGHALLDMMPRAALLHAVCPPAWPIALPATAPAWLVGLMREAAPGRPVISWRPEDQAIQAPAVLGCGDVAMPGFVRPELAGWARLLRARLLARPLLSREALARPAPPAPPPRPSRLLYVSRAGARSPIHSIDNEEEVEDALARRGWRVLRPETLDLAGQARAFAEARLVVGEYGSAMHNAIFSDPGTTVVCLNRLNGYQSRIAQAFGHRLGFVAPLGGFRDDLTLLATGVTAMRVDLPALLERLRPLEEEATG